MEGPAGKVLHVNGRLTLGENIADAGGLTASFHAWKKRDVAAPDLHLPGLSQFTKEQLFFLSYGNWWCGKTTKEAAEQAIYNDPHAPKAARNIVRPISLTVEASLTSSRKPWQTHGNSERRSAVRRRNRSVSSGSCHRGVAYKDYSLGIPTHSEKLIFSGYDIDLHAF